MQVYDCYEIHGIYKDPFEGWEEMVGDDEAMYFCLYGHTPGIGITALIDRSTRKECEEEYFKLFGKEFEYKL